MYDPRTTPLDPRHGFDQSDLFAGVLVAIVSLLSTTMFVLLYLPPR